MVGRRLRRLSDEANRALAVAAIVGLEFDLDVVAHAVDRDPGELLDERRRRRGGDCLGARCWSLCVHPRPHPRHGGRGRCLPDAHLHGRVAAAIEALRRRRFDPWLADLAFHHAESATATQRAAVEYALLAPQQARAQAAVDEAVAPPSRACRRPPR